MWDGQVKVITGIRRCGKSYLLDPLFSDYLLEQGIKKEQILSQWNTYSRKCISVEDDRLREEFEDKKLVVSYINSITSYSQDQKVWLYEVFL